MRRSVRIIAPIDGVACLRSPPSSVRIHAPLFIVIAGLDPAIHCAEALSMGGSVYILANEPNGTLYIGVTNDLVRRIHEHREKQVEGFTKRHDVERLVYFECYDAIRDALQREKNLKKWSRAWKIALIEENNPDWHDLYSGIAGE
jgi:putative endonuclease